MGEKSQTWNMVAHVADWYCCMADGNMGTRACGPRRVDSSWTVMPPGSVRVLEGPLTPPCRWAGSSSELRLAASPYVLSIARTWVPKTQEKSPFSPCPGFEWRHPSRRPVAPIRQSSPYRRRHSVLTLRSSDLLRVCVVRKGARLYGRRGRQGGEGGRGEKRIQPVNEINCPRSSRWSDGGNSINNTG
jgi:hypothetical protein